MLISQSLPSEVSACHFAPSLRLFVPNSLQALRRLFFSECCAYDIRDRSRLPLWLGSHGDYCPTAPSAPPLRSFVPSGFLIRCEQVQVHHHIPFRGLCFGRHFFRFGGGRPLHNVQMENSTAGLATSSPIVCLTGLVDFFLSKFSRSTPSRILPRQPPRFFFSVAA
jgi:hypothetical protein